MISKISRKNQVTLPKKVVEKLGFSPSEQKYVNFEVHGNTVLMKPVTLIIEEKLSDEQLDRFRDWALDHERDVDFDSAEEATEFLRKRMKR